MVWYILSMAGADGGGVLGVLKHPPFNARAE